MPSKSSNKIRQLATVIDAQLEKYQYLLARYLNDTTVDIRNSWEYNNFFISWGFDPVQDADLSRSAYTNVIKSVIDTLVSQLANEKVRPYFTPNNGDYETRQTVKQVQKYFDIAFDNANVHNLICKAFLESCIFGKGYLWVNPFTWKIEILPTWTVGLLHTEELYGEPTSLLVKYINFPASLLEKDYNIKLNDAREYVTLSFYIDTLEKKAQLFVGTDKKKSIEWKPETLPIIELNYTKDIFGAKGRGIVEELDGIQTQIDLINAKISAAAQLTAANTTYVIEGSNLRPSDIDNRVGKVYGIKMPPGVNTPPVVNVTPVPFDPMWQNLLDYYIKQAYEIIGVNQLDAQAKKPAGLDSGVALQTMEDIASNRFETQMQSYIKAYVDLAKIVISVMPEDTEILPKNIKTTELTWKDIKKDSELFKVQYSAATALSKDPQERMKQIIQLSEMGLIGADKLAVYLDSPDFSEALEGAQAVQNAIDKCIELAIENGEVNIPDFVAYQKLAEAITITQNQIYASISKNDNKREAVNKALENLKKLEDTLLERMQNEGFIESSENEALETSLGTIQTQGASIPSGADTIMANASQGTEPGQNEALQPQLSQEQEMVDMTEIEEPTSEQL